MSQSEIIGNNIKFLRNKIGLNQEEIADFLGIDRVNISYYEKGLRNIPIKHLEKIADLFGVEMADLYEENPDLIKANIAFAFRTDSLDANSLNTIAIFGKFVKNYLKVVNLESINAD